jgi:hypothetical protein
MDFQQFFVTVLAHVKITELVAVADAAEDRNIHSTKIAD